MNDVVGITKNVEILTTDGLIYDQFCRFYGRLKLPKSMGHFYERMMHAKKDCTQ